MPPDHIEYNQDELEAPAWMDADFFNTVLRHCTQHEDIQVSSYKMTPASAKGDHYASVMFRGSVEYVRRDGATQSKSLIIKTMPEYEGHKKEMLGESYIFETEIGMYSEVIPQVEAILRESGDDTVIGAPCLYHSLEPRKVIVFEDIVPHGYIVVRDRNVNVEEVKGAYTKLAKMQAVSLKMLQENPSCFDIYRHHLMVLPSMKKSDFMTDGIKNFVAMLKDHPSLHGYVPYFEPLQEDLVDRCQHSFTEYWSRPRSDTVYTLGHGDFHGKNMMFKFSPCGKFEDVKLLDFQMCYMGSFVLDLIYSVFMLADRQMRANRMHELFEHYVREFNATADRIGYTGKRPEMKDLWEQIKIHRHWLVFLLTTFLPMWEPFQTADIDPDTFMKSAECRKSLYSKQPYIDEMHVLLPKYKDLGYFDDL